MKRILPLSDLLKVDNCMYTGESNYVLIGDKEYQFVKGYLSWNALRFYHPKYRTTKNHPAAYILQIPATGEVYVGSSGKVGFRVSSHKTEIRNKQHTNPGLNKIVKEKSLDDFEVIVLFTDQREEAYDLEQLLADQYRPTGRLLNKGTDVRYVSKGVKLSEEHAAALLKANIGAKRSEEARANISSGLRKAHLDNPQYRQRISFVKKTNQASVQQTNDVLARKRQPVSVDGVVYKSLTEAGIQSVYSEAFLRRQLRKGTSENIFYVTEKRSPLSGRKLSDDVKKALSVKRKSDPKLIGQLNSIRYLVMKKIFLNGVLYDSIMDAARKTGIGESTIRKKLTMTKGSRDGDVYILNYERKHKSEGH